MFVQFHRKFLHFRLVFASFCANFGVYPASYLFPSAFPSKKSRMPQYRHTGSYYIIMYQPQYLL